MRHRIKMGMEIKPRFTPHTAFDEHGKVDPTSLDLDNDDREPEAAEPEEDRTEEEE